MQTYGLTPLEYSRAQRRPPFHAGITRRGIPELRKIGGYIVASDGDSPERVKRNQVYAPWLDEGGEWRICSFWNPEAQGPAKAEASLWTIRKWSATGKLVRGRACEYEEVRNELVTTYPGIWIPEERKFWAEYGL